MPSDHPFRIRVLDEDGLTTLFFLHDEPDRMLKSYKHSLKDRMILSIEDDDTNTLKIPHLYRSRSVNNGEKPFLFDETDV